MELHTDLAVEIREKYEEDNVEISGVELKVEHFNDGKIKVITVIISDESGAQKMGKPVGTYITIEAESVLEIDDEAVSMSDCAMKQLEKILPEKCEKGILVVGLGNRQVTPDMLGPLVIDKLLITRHIFNEIGNEIFGEKPPLIVSALSPGVMAQTGIEAVDVIGGVLEKIDIDCVIVVDALASRNVSRLNSTIQITDTGICPGSGVGNHRKGITKDTVGKKVIAIGVPTVVDAYTIIRDSFSKYMTKELIDDNKFHKILENTIMPNTSEMIVTPKNIDEAVRKMAEIIANALNGIIEK